jgi:hypothetical protein
VELIGEIRRAYFEQRRPIKAIVRTLAVSRATVPLAGPTNSRRPPLREAGAFPVGSIRVGCKARMPPKHVLEGTVNGRLRGTVAISATAPVANC